MIQQYDLLFDRNTKYSDIIKKAEDEDGTLLKTKLGADAGVGMINLQGLVQRLNLNQDGSAVEEEVKEDPDDSEGEDIFAQM